MTTPDHLLDRPVVLDASVLINLVVVDDPVAVLRALPEPKVVVACAAEVKRNPRTRETGDAVLKRLLRGPLALVDLDDEDAELFVGLVSAGAPDDLDDAEAATLAYATRRGLIPLVDDPKGLRIAAERLAPRTAVTTVGLYRGLLKRGLLDPDFISRCVYDSLRYARMRVQATDLDWVVGQLSSEELANCPSLPRGSRVG